jgi:hypothetical protein
MKNKFRGWSGFGHRLAAVGSETIRFASAFRFREALIA